MYGYPNEKKRVLTRQACAEVERTLSLTENAADAPNRSTDEPHQAGRGPAHSPSTCAVGRARPAAPTLSGASAARRPPHRRRTRRCSADSRGCCPVPLLRRRTVLRRLSSWQRCANFAAKKRSARSSRLPWQVPTYSRRPRLRRQSRCCPRRRCHPSRCYPTRYHPFGAWRGPRGCCPPPVARVTVARVAAAVEAAAPAAEAAAPVAEAAAPAAEAAAPASFRSRSYSSCSRAMQSCALGYRPRRGQRSTCCIVSTGRGMCPRRRSSIGSATCAARTR